MFVRLITPLNLVKGWRVTSITGGFDTELGQGVIETGDVWNFTVKKPLQTDFITVPVTKDTYIDSGKPTTTYAGSTVLVIGEAEGLLPTRRAYLSFDLSGIIPADHQIASATLRLWTDRASNFDTEVYKTGNPTWDDTELTWDNKDNYFPALASSELVSSGSVKKKLGTSEFDVTDAITGDELTLMVTRQCLPTNVISSVVKR